MLTMSTLFRYKSDMSDHTTIPDSPGKIAFHHGDLRRSLLDATLSLIAANGVQGFTLREAARAAGVSHNAPYRHFPSRTHLLVELAIEGQGLLLEALESESSIRVNVLSVWGWLIWTLRSNTRLSFA